MRDKGDDGRKGTFYLRKRDYSYKEADKNVLYTLCGLNNCIIADHV
jgi:hypothetical protein